MLFLPSTCPVGSLHSNKWAPVANKGCKAKIPFCAGMKPNKSVPVCSYGRDPQLGDDYCTSPIITLKKIYPVNGIKTFLFYPPSHLVFYTCLALRLAKASGLCLPFVVHAMSMPRFTLSRLTFLLDAKGSDATAGGTFFIKGFVLTDSG